MAEVRKREEIHIISREDAHRYFTANVQETSGADLEAVKMIAHKYPI